MRFSKAHYYLVYRPLRAIMKAAFRIIYGYRCDKVTLPEGGTLVVANHTANVDPFFCVSAFKEPVSFVMSEHLLRKPLLKKVMDALIDSITRVKTRTESQAAMTMIKRLRQGNNILIFPEGKMTYTGVSDKNMPGLGRLVKISGCNLMTMRLEDTFGVSARWMKKQGRGSCYGRVVKIYTAAELKEKSADEIEQIIESDTFFDFYAQLQTGNYSAKHRAECLQSALFMCPKCGKMSTLHSRGSRFWCNCGLDLELNKKLRFESRKAGEQPPFETIAQWYDWQKEQVKQQAETWLASDALITQDEGIQVNSYTVSPPTTTPITKGIVKLYPNRLEVEGDVSFSVELDHVTDVSTVVRRLFSFSVDHEKYYEFVGTDDFSPVKYAYIVAALTNTRAMI